MNRFAVCLLIAAPVLAQSIKNAPQDLRFDVVSLKPSIPGGRGGGIRPAEGGLRYIANNVSIKGMITVAYRLKPDQVVGAPAWLDSDLFDMEGKAEKPSNADELHVMLMNMLADRLQLKFHHEQREMRRYELTVDKDGPKLTRHDPQNPHDSWIDIGQEKFLHLKLNATAVPLDYVAFQLGNLMDLPVVDLTGLKGSYDFTLTFTRDLPPGFPEGGKVNGEDPDLSGLNVYQALKQQLGLNLKAQRGPTDVIVIDHVEKPTAN
jgi:uncharacterized protein (TIGR03435 family)